jgi:GTPase KRas protein
MRNRFGYLLVIDLTEPRSLDDILVLIESIKRVRDADTFPAVMCLNKSDLKERKISNEEVEEFIRKNLGSCPMFETSAKFRTNIDESFHQLVRECRKAAAPQQLRKQSTVKRSTSTAKQTTRRSFLSSGSGQISDDVEESRQYMNE